MQSHELGFSAWGNPGCNGHRWWNIRPSPATHCATFNQGPYEQLKADFIDTGRIQYIKARSIFLTAMACGPGWSRAAGGGERYHGIVEMLYDQQSEWGGARMTPRKLAANLRRLGRQAGMNDAELNACLEDADTALALTRIFTRPMHEGDNIRATPTFIIKTGRAIRTAL